MSWNNALMRKRITLTSLLAAFVVLAGVPAMPAKAAETKYDFEKCEQGWTAKKGGNWKRTSSHPGSSNTTPAMSNFIYQADHDRGDTLISKEHQWPGGKKKIKLRARWQFEWFPPETGPTIATLDRAALETSTDGGKTWKSRIGFSLANPAFPEFSNVEAEVDLPAGPVLFRFVLFSDFSIEMFGIEVDDVVIPTSAPDGIGCK